MPRRADETDGEYRFRLETTLMEVEIEQRLQQIRLDAERHAKEQAREGLRMFFAGVGAGAVLITAATLALRLIFFHQ